MEIHLSIIYTITLHNSIYLYLLSSFYYTIVNDGILMVMCIRWITTYHLYFLYVMFILFTYLIHLDLYLILFSCGFKRRMNIWRMILRLIVKGKWDLRNLRNLLIEVGFDVCVRVRWNGGWYFHGLCFMILSFRGCLLIDKILIVLLVTSMYIFYLLFFTEVFPIST